MDVATRPTVARWAVRAGVAVVALSAVGVLLLVTVIPLLTGGHARSVRSGSMAPAIPQGALVLDRPVTIGDLHVGDVVTYGMASGGRRIVVTHRIVAIDRSASPALLTMRGDANRTADVARVPADAVQGRVWLVVPWVGGIQGWLTGARWPLLAFLAAGAGTYLWAAAALRRARGATS